MSRPFLRALFLTSAAASLTIGVGAAGAVETWVGTDGEIRVVPGTEDQLLLPPQRAKPAPLRGPTQPNPHAAAKPRQARPDRAATVPLKGLPQSHSSPLAGLRAGIDQRPTGAVTNDGLGGNGQAQGTPIDPQTMQPMPARLLRPSDTGSSAAQLPAARLATDPGNAVIVVDPAPDTVEKSNPDDDLIDSNLYPTDPVAPVQPVPARPVPGASIRSSANSGGASPAVRTTQPVAAGQQAGQDASGGDPGQSGGGNADLLLPTFALPIPQTAPVTAVAPQAPGAITGSVAVAPQQSVPPNPRFAVDDPLADQQVARYDQAGIEANSFVWRPAIELSGGATSNIQGTPHGTASTVLRVAPELIGQSDWSRHQLAVDIHGTFTAFPQDTALFRPTGSATVSGRIDFSEETQLALKTSYGLDKLPSTSALNAAGDTVAGLQETAMASAALTRDIGLFALTMRGEVDRTDYKLSALEAATTPADTLANTDLITALRGTYNLSAGLKPFVEVQADARRYDAGSFDTITASTVSHDTTGTAVKGGLTLNLGPILTGETSAGYGLEAPTDHSLQMLRAFTVDDSIIWSPTRQTRVTVSTVTALEPSLTANASGAVSRTVGVKFADDIFRNLTLELGGSYLARHYTGIYRTEYLDEATTALTWKITPTVQTFVRGTFDSFSSSAHTDDYTSATVYAGVRLQK